MKLSFRWYGKDDPVTLDKIRQIPGMHTIVSALYEVPPGAVWPEESICALKQEITGSGLHFEVVESVPVHEDIKLGKDSRDRFIGNYCENIRRLGRAGVRVVCYNFMPVFDWTRSRLDHPLPDGSNALVYYSGDIEKLDVRNLSLPGWDASYQPEEISTLIGEYQTLGEEGLWGNLAYFLQRVVPVAAEYDVKLAIHPDDPPWDIFGLPRIITGGNSLDRLLSLHGDSHHGLALCSGSLGCLPDNDIPAMIRKYGGMGRIHFAHVRNVKIIEGNSFEESAHYSPCGSLDLVEIMSAYYKTGFTGYLRPDHGRMIWGETGKPGYGLYDRALGAQYLLGIWETLDKLNRGRG